MALVGSCRSKGAFQQHNSYEKNKHCQNMSENSCYHELEDGKKALRKLTSTYPARLSSRKYLLTSITSELYINDAYCKKKNA
jgi:hypothetical protein